MPDTLDEYVKRYKHRSELKDAIAIHEQGLFYREGRNGFPQDYTKALELFRRAVDLGNAEAYSNIGYLYWYGEGVEVDKKKARHHFELAAIKGNVVARHNLGVVEGELGNFDRSLKHHMIAAGGGYADSLGYIKLLYKNRQATKEDFTKVLQDYQKYLDEIKSAQRDKAAAAANEDNRYH